MVRIIEKIEIFNFFDKKAWCDHVIEAPEDNKISEFKSGILIGLKVEIPKGGQIIPKSILGEILIWKNAQKNPVNSIISEIINIIILNLISFIVV